MSSKSQGSMRGKEPEYSAITCPDVRKLKIKRGAKAILSLQFLPVHVGVHKTQVRFLDEKVGEFTYEVHALSQLPAPLDTMTFECDAKGTVQKMFQLSQRNPLLDKIRMRLPDTSGAEASGRQSQARQKTPAAASPDAPMVFQVQYLSEFLGGAQTVGIAAPSGARASTANGGTEPFSFTFHPRGPGTYKGQIVLQGQPSDSVASDVRVYSVDVTAVPETVTVDLEFNTPAGMPVTQDIPIVNRSQQNWKIQAAVSGEGFSGAREILIEAGADKSYTLTFSPAWICESKGQLVLINTVTSERYVYRLTGVAEEPLAEGHLKLECQARQRTSIMVPVSNPSSSEVTFTVDTDLAVFAGAETVLVPAKSQMQYELQVVSQRGGSHTGSITFTAPDARYQWYTVELTSSRPPAEQTLSISSTVRQAVQVDIAVQNPLAEAVDFEVLFDGAGLLGDPFLMLAPRETRTYTLIFSPLRAGQTVGGVAFVNERCGEFWYELNLSAAPAPPIRVAPTQAEVGREHTFGLSLENPSGVEVEVVCTSTNPRNFYVEPPTLTVAAYGTLEIPVVYNPSSVRRVQSADIVVSVAGIDDWVYQCSGRGVPPTTMDATTVTAGIGNPSSQVLVFRNPFSEPLVISIRLITDERPKIFEVVLKRTDGIMVNASQSLQIPFAFSPRQMMDHKALVEISGSAEGVDLCWQFPVRGIAEAPRAGRSFKFVTKARQRIEEVVEITPHGLGEISETEYFNFDVVCPSDHDAAMMDRSLSITPLVAEVAPGGSGVLKFKLVFEPLRPVETSVELLLSKVSGGRWRYTVLLEAGEPEVDDTIVIEAPLGRGASVSFRLSNPLSDYAPFRAYFTPDSPSEFTVFPHDGVFETPGAGSAEGDGRDGTPFVISYAPREYGKRLVGKLVIMTSEMQWTYEVIGQHPRYAPPTDMAAKVECRLPDEMASQLGRSPGKNYIKENLVQAGRKTEADFR